jgi:hypothetical protein
VSSPNAIDLLFALLLAGSIVFLVRIYLSQPTFRQSIQISVVIIGLLWLVYALFAEEISWYLMGVPWWDAHYHEYKGYLILDEIKWAGWRALVDNFATGNAAYQCYNAVILSTGASICTLTAINGVLAFWGGLVLVNCFSRICPFPRNYTILIYAIVFCPSVFFWCTVNLKEAWMFWCICMLFSVSFTGRLSEIVLRLPLVFAGVVIGGILRPHVMLGWVAALAGIVVLRRGKRTIGILILLTLPFIAVAFQKHTQMEFNTDMAIQLGETHARTIAGISSGSTYEYATGKPIFFLSGLFAALFRPFPWEVSSPRILVSSLETWAITFILFYGWLKLSAWERRQLFSRPAIQVAILASIWMCLVLTYFPNEGLMIRQKVQMIPALLALALLPLTGRRFLKAYQLWKFRQLSSSMPVGPDTRTLPYVSRNK